GRNSTCEIAIDEAGVSRLHARVELRRDGFVLIDQSRNGTILQNDWAAPRTILHGQAALDGAGTLQLGPQDGAPVIAFAVRVRRGWPTVLDLAKVPLFRGLDHDARARFSQVATLRSVRAGSLILRKGASGRELLVVASGGVTVRAMEGAPPALLGPGEVL